MVELVDGSVIAQMGVTDMRHPIQYALTFPDRWETSLPPLYLAAVGRLDFQPPDRAAVPCLALAERALREGHGAPAALNAANEVAVASFLERRIPFRGIPRIIEETLDR